MLRGLRDESMFIHIEYTPDMVVLKIHILPQPRIAFGRLWNAALENFQLDNSTLRAPDVAKVSRLGYFPLTHE